jgi:CrcB protein
MGVLVWVGVSVLGGVGALLRFGLDGSIQRRRAGVFPAGTLVVNLSGAFCLGLLTGSAVTGDALLLTGTALLGSFTTFSTWMLETERLGEEGEGRLAVVNLGLSLVAGLAAAALGWALGSLL